MSTVLVFAPHPDDETLGCGGTLLRAIAQGASVHWAIASTMRPEYGFTADRIAARDREISEVTSAYGFAGVHRGLFPSTRLDTVPMAERVSWCAGVIGAVRPDTLYLPCPNDVHSDHAAVFDAAAACTKVFRHPSVRRVYAYETVSETEFGLRPGTPAFQPQRFVNIEEQLERKIDIMGLYSGEMGEAPFPRSATILRALATFRGTVAGTKAAEAFIVLRDIE